MLWRHANVKAKETFHAGRLISDITRCDGCGCWLPVLDESFGMMSCV